MNEFDNRVNKASALCQQMIDITVNNSFKSELKDIKSSIEFSAPEIFNFHFNRITECVNKLVQGKTKETVTDSEIAVLAVFTKKTPKQIRKCFH